MRHPFRSSFVRVCHPVRLLTPLLAGALVVVACGSPPAADDVRLTGAAPAQDVTVPAGTMLLLSMMTPVWSDMSHADDPVTAELTTAVMIEGRRVLPVGSTVSGVVTSAEESGRVKGRAHVTIEFTALQTGGTRYDINTESFSNPPAGAQAGGSGAAATGVVRAAADRNVRIGRGTDVSTRLTAPLTVRVQTGDQPAL